MTAVPSGHVARLKPCCVNDWKHGRWRRVERTRVTNDRDDCRGGGVPIGARLVIYADAGLQLLGEDKFDFDWNVEERNVPASDAAYWSKRSEDV